MYRTVIPVDIQIDGRILQCLYDTSLCSEENELIHTAINMYFELRQ